MSERSRNYTDILSGTLLIAAGIFVTVYSISSYRLGTLANMGPGMLPAGMGVLLSLLGLMIFIPAFTKTASLPTFQTRPAFFVLAGIGAFALLVAPFGMVPAVVALTILTAKGDTKLGVWGICLLATVLTLMTTLIFSVGLNVPFKLFDWPF